MFRKPVIVGGGTSFPPPVTEDVPPVVHARLTLGSAGEIYLEHLDRVLERKPTTVADYGSMLRTHVDRFFGQRPPERIDPENVAAYPVRHLQPSAYQADEDLVFVHPETGNPLDPAKLRRR